VGAGREIEYVVWELGEKLKLNLQISKSWIVDVVTSVKKEEGSYVDTGRV